MQIPRRFSAHSKKMILPESTRTVTKDLSRDILGNLIK